jgi:hypothetical protein
MTPMPVLLMTPTPALMTTTGARLLGPSPDTAARS